MTNKRKLIGYHQGQGLIYQLSGTSKLLFFLLVSIAAMVTYDTRLIVAIATSSLALFRLSGIKIKEVGFVFILTAVFASLNIFMVYLFAPDYGTVIYGSRTLLSSGFGSYQITSQTLFYLLNLLLKYFCTIPLAVIFLMTTHPSQFASSLNQLGISYKIAYAVSLTMRYIPDLQEEFYTIRQSQEARGLELSHKAKLMARIKGNLHIVTPLIFSSLARIETISTAMELRRFGKNKHRTWWTYQKLRSADYLVILLAMAILAVAFLLIHLNQGRFYNPWG